MISFQDFHYSRLKVGKGTAAFNLLILFSSFIRTQIFLFVVLCPTREFFTRMETSPLPVKGFLFGPILGQNFSVHTYCVTGHPFIMRLQ